MNIIGPKPTIANEYAPKVAGSHAENHTGTAKLQKGKANAHENQNEDLHNKMRKTKMRKGERI